MKKNIVLVSGGYDPLHSGHIAYFDSAKNLGDYLIVGVNSDEWLTRKKGRPFMKINDRASIIENLSMVDECWKFDGNFDADGSCIKMIENALYNYPQSKIIFANGGDRTSKNIPEMQYFSGNDRVDFVFGVGGTDKKNSSSWILDEWKTQKTERPWGFWRVLDEKANVKVKELVINPDSALSDQRHSYRNEHWYILSGKLDMHLETPTEKQTITMEQHDTCIIKKYTWHRAHNKYQEPCHVLEVQYGEKCEENDIERRN